MALKAIRFVSLYLTALLAGMLFCHLLELPAKMRLPGPIWLTLQQRLYNMFGPVACVIEPLAIVATLVLLIMDWRRRQAFVLTFIALLCLSAHLARGLPSSTRSTSKKIPGLRPRCPRTHARNRWEYGHAGGAGLALVALAALIAGALTDRSGGPHNRH